MALLIGGAEFVLPGWIGRFRAAMIAYRQYTGGNSLADVLLTARWGTLLITLALLGLAAVCWRLRSYPADSAEFSLAFSLVLAVTLLVIPMMAPYNQVLLLPAIFLIIRSGKALWRRNSFTRFVCALAIVLVFWPWVAEFGLMLCALVVPPTSLQQAWAVPLYTSLGIPPSIAGLLVLLLEKQTARTKLR